MLKIELHKLQYIKVKLFFLFNFYILKILCVICSDLGKVHAFSQVVRNISCMLHALLFMPKILEKINMRKYGKLY